MSTPTKVKSSGSSVFERLASSNTSVRSAGSARSPTVAAKSPTAATAAKSTARTATPQRAATPTTVAAAPSSPKAKAPPPKSPAAPPPAARSTASPAASSTAKGTPSSASSSQNQQQQDQQANRSGSAHAEPSSSLKTASSSSSYNADGSQQQQPGKEQQASTGAAEQQQQDRSSNPSATPPPAPQPAAVEATAEEAEQIAQLTKTRDERAQALAAVEEELTIYALRYKAANAQERAVQFQKRTEDTNAENKRMRKDIDTLRNADRVMVTLRDTVDTMKKHQRIRSAHIRQKIATIELIAKRCIEQRQERVKMLDILETNADLVANLAVEESAWEEVVSHTDPLRSMAALLRQDGSDEEFIESVVRDMAVLHEQDVAATAALQSELKRLEFGIHTASGDSSATMEEITAQWTDTKARMLYEYQRLCKLGEELEHHVKRGTHIKSVAQLPQAVSSDEDKLRALILALGETEEGATRAQANAAAAQQRLSKLPASHRSEIAAKEVECTLSARREAQFEEANEEWRRRFAELQVRYTEAAIEDASVAMRLREMHLMASSGAGGADQQNHSSHSGGASPSPSRRSESMTLPPSTARSLTDRLYESHTKSQQVRIACTQFETEDRRLRSAQMRWRPTAAKLPASS